MEFGRASGFLIVILSVMGELILCSYEKLHYLWT
jgi:hypothetical protein